VKKAWVLAIAAACAAAHAQEQPPFPREMRAVWVATVSNIDWPSSRTRTPVQQRNEALAILDKAVELRLNAVILQIRPACDALYPSKYEPWSEYLTNKMGVPPSPLYDPLQFWIDEARKRGLELHAWFNPYRARASSGVGPADARHVSNKFPWIVRTYGNQLWLDPGDPLTPRYTMNVIFDVLARYDIDAVHFDDYFYPYPISGTPFPDDSTYSAYLDSGGVLSRGDWRRENVNGLVRNLYFAIRGLRPGTKFGISPFGIWRPNNPPGITGLDAYASIYADSRKWLQQGWVDYLTPQLYWRIDPPQQSYPALLDWWVQQNTQLRHIWPGNFTSNVGSQFGDWPISEILNQIDITRNQAGATGNVHFSSRALMGNWKGIADALKTGPYAAPALVPATPWLDNTAPPKPSLSTSANATTRTFNWNPGVGEPARRYAACYRYGTRWTFEIVPSTVLSKALPLSNGFGSLNAFQIAAVDKVGNEGERAIWQAAGKWDERR